MAGPVLKWAPDPSMPNERIQAFAGHLELLVVRHRANSFTACIPGRWWSEGKATTQRKAQVLAESKALELGHAIIAAFEESR